MQNLNRQEASDRIRVGEYILFFLKEDIFCKELTSDYFQSQSSSGFLELFCKIHFGQIPETQNIVPWFMNRVFNDISSIQNAEKKEFREIIERLNKLDSNYLEIIYRLTKKYKINPDDLRKNLKKYLSNLSKEDASQILFALFSSGILHSEVIILNAVYSHWFGNI